MEFLSLDIFVSEDLTSKNFKIPPVYKRNNAFAAFVVCKDCLLFVRTVCCL